MSLTIKKKSELSEEELKQAQKTSDERVAKRNEERQATARNALSQASSKTSTSTTTTDTSESYFNTITARNILSGNSGVSHLTPKYRTQNKIIIGTDKEEEGYTDVKGNEVTGTAKMLDTIYRNNNPEESEEADKEKEEAEKQAYLEEITPKSTSEMQIATNILNGTNSTDTVEKNEKISEDLGSLLAIGVDSFVKQGYNLLDYVETTTEQTFGDEYTRKREMEYMASPNVSQEDKIKLSAQQKGFFKADDEEEIETNLVKKHFRDKVSEYSEEISKFQSKINNEGIAKVGELLPSLVNSATGGAISVVNPFLGTEFFVLTASDDYMQDGLSRGMTEDQSYVYGTIMGMLEGLSESVVTGQQASKIYKSLTGEIISNSVLNSEMVNFYENALQEMVMEPAQELVATITGGSDTADWSDMGTRILDSGMNGALMGAISNGATYGLTNTIEVLNKLDSGETVSESEYMKALQENIDYFGEEAVMQALQEGASTTYEGIESIIKQAQESVSQAQDNNVIAPDNTQTNVTENNQDNTVVAPDYTNQTNQNENQSNFYSNQDKYILDNTEEIIDLFNEKETYTEEDVDRIWEEVYDKNLNFSSDTTSAGDYVESIWLITDDNNNLVVNRSNENNEVVDSRTIAPDSNGEYNREDIQNAIKELAKVEDDLAPIEGQVDIEGNTVQYGKTQNNQETIAPVIQDNTQENTSNSNENNQGNKYVTIEEKMSQFKNMDLDSSVENLRQKGIQLPQATVDLLKNIQNNREGLTIILDDTLQINSDSMINAVYDSQDKSNRRIVIDPRSSKSIESLVTHELLHDLEGTTEYETLKQQVLDYASQKSEFQEAYQTLYDRYAEVYKGRENSAEMIENEAVNDMVAEMLGNQEFLNTLAQQKPNVFIRAYNWVKDFIKRIGNSNEKFLQDVQKKFRQAYETSYAGESNNEVKYSLAGENAENSSESSFSVTKDGDLVYTDNDGNQNQLYFRFDNENTFNENEHKSGISNWEDIIDDELSTYVDDISEMEEREQEVDNLLQQYGTTLNEYEELSEKEQFKIKQEIAIDRGLVTNGASVYDLSTNGLEFFSNYHNDHTSGYKEVRIFTGEQNGWGADGESVVIPDKTVLKMSAEEFETMFDDIYYSIEDDIENLSDEDKFRLFLNEITNKLQDSSESSFSLNGNGELVDQNNDKVTLNAEDVDTILPLSDDKKLMAIHNLDASKLESLLDLGGIPSPSIAITDTTKNTHSDFGDISLVFDKATINPADSRNEVYDRDVWSPTFPSVEYNVDNTSINKMIKDNNIYNKNDNIQRQSNISYFTDVNLGDLVNRRGIDGTLQALKESKTLKYTYLQTIMNGEYNPIMKDYQYNSKYSNEVLQEFLDSYTGDAPLNDLSSEQTMELADQIKEIYRPTAEQEIQSIEEEYKNSDKQRIKQALINDVYPSTFNDYDSFIRSAYELQQNGINNQVIDETATFKDVESKVNQADYEKWVDDTFGEMLENTEKGIRNDKDYYTNSGNPRSFKQLHNDYTLENIVDYMISQQTQGSQEGFIGAGFNEIASSLANRFESIEDIKQAESRITTSEQAKDILQPISDQLYNDIEQLTKYYNGSSFDNQIARTMEAQNNISKAIKEFARKDNLTVAELKESLSDYMGIGIDVDSITNKELQNVVNDLKLIKEIPTDYFEAKPQRAVGFDEVQAVVVPNDTSETLLQKLYDKGLTVIEYDKTVEGDRANKINELNQYKFSMNNSQNQWENFVSNNFNLMPDGTRTYGRDYIAPLPNERTIQQTFDIFNNAKGTVSRDVVIEVANNLDITLKKGTEKIIDTIMVNKSGQNKNPSIISITKLFENITDKNAKEFRSDAIEEAMELFRDTEAVIKDTNTVAEINKSGLKKTFSGNVTESKIQTADNLKEILEEGIYRYTTKWSEETQNKNNQVLYHHFFTPVQYNGSNGLIRFVIKEFRNDNSLKDKFYYHQLEYISNENIKGDASLSYPTFYSDSKNGEITSPFADADVNASAINTIIPQNEGNMQASNDVLLPEPAGSVYEDISSDDLEAIKKESDYLMSRIEGEAKEDIALPDTTDYISEKRTKEKVTMKDITKFGTDLRQKLVNKGEYVDNLAKATKNKNLTYAYDRRLASFAEAQASIGGVGQTDINGEIVGKSIKEIFKASKDNNLYTEFNDYLFNRHNIDRSALDKAVYGNRVTQSQSETKVAEYEKSHPEFKEWAEDVYKFNRNELKNRLDAGFISQATYDSCLELYQSYVPTYRDIVETFSEYDEKVGSNPFKSATGGDSNLLAIDESMAEQEIAFRRALRTNEVGKELYKSLGKDSKVFEGIEFNDPNVIETLAGEVIQQAQDGTAVFTIFNNGEMTQFRISEDIYKAFEVNKIEEAINNNNVAKALLGKVAKLSQFERDLLTTYSIGFSFNNPIKDFQDGIFNTKYSGVEFVTNWTKAFYEMATKGDYYLSYKANGGGANTYFDYETGILNDSNNVVKKFTDKIRTANEVLETAPRLAEYMTTLKHGGTINEAMYNSAEITTNFKRGGDVAKAINKYGGNFFNASIQGLDKQFRNLTGQNGWKGYASLVTKAVAYGVVPAILNHLLLDDDDDYQDLPDYIKDEYYLFKKGDGEFYRIPKGRVLSIIGSVARRTLELAQGEEDAFEGLGSTIVNQIAPNNPLTDNIIAPIVQASNNETWYGTELVSDYMSTLPEAEQYDAKTDEFSKWLGEKLNISPKKINYVLDQYSGGIGDVVLPMLTPYAENNMLEDKFTTDSVLKNKHISEFYDTVDELEINNNSSNSTDEDTLMYKYMSSISSEMSDLYKQKSSIESDDSLTDAEKKEQTREIQKQINELAENGLDSYENVKIKSDYATIGDTEYYKNSSGSWTKVTEDLSDLNMNTTTKNTYYKTKNSISSIYNNEDLESDEKKEQIIEELTSSKLTDEQKASIYKSYYSSSSENVDFILSSSIPLDDYLNYTTQDFSADKDSNGNSISGTAKAKVVHYVNSLDLSLPQKAILIRMKYSSYDDYDSQIISYVRGLSITSEEQDNILKKLKIIE